MKLPYPWSDYALLQGELASASAVDDRSWGLEAGLARLLVMPDEPRAPLEISRAMAAESRRERHRARLRRLHLEGFENAPEAESMIDARERLRSVQSRVSLDDWALLWAIGHGHKYRELADKLGVAPGGLRVRVLRLRRAA